MSDSDRNMQDDVAAGERWLAEFERPLPTQAVIERTKHAVRVELRESDWGNAGKQWTAWHGALAAAATIALAVTVAWHSTQSAGPTIGAPLGAEEVTVLPAETEEALMAMADLEEAMSDLEEWSTEEAWDLDGAALYEALESATDSTPNGDPQGAGTSLMWPSALNKAEEA